MFLADTNIFLEVLLAGNKAEMWKVFLDQNPGKIHLSDFSVQTHRTFSFFALNDQNHLNPARNHFVNS